jgi:hypothetical protein
VYVFWYSMSVHARCEKAREIAPNREALEMALKGIGVT